MSKEKHTVEYLPFESDFSNEDNWKISKAYNCLDDAIEYVNDNPAFDYEGKMIWICPGVDCFYRIFSETIIRKYRTWA